MEVDKRGAKGGFFQLFDWNNKSRKKLFSGEPKFPESSNQGKGNYHGSYITRNQQGLEKEFLANPTGQNDYYHYANNDSEYGTKPPGVVARLMGLDSLPTSKVKEPDFTTLFRESSAPFQGEHKIVISESMRNKLDMKSDEMRCRHLERFQTEVLPPKHAKPISVAHNRLLSPVRSPGVVPPRNAAYIIEAAAKIIEQSPRSATKAHFPSLGSSSVPIRVCDMEDKASRRSSRPVEKGKGQIFINPKKHVDTVAKSRSQGSCVPKGSFEESKRAQRTQSKEKQLSLAVQKSDGLSSLANRSFERQKDPSNMRRKMVTRTTTSPSNPDVLRQNIQKQNCAFDKTFGSSKDRKELSVSSNHYLNGRVTRKVNKIVVSNVVASRKTNFVVADPGKGITSSRAKMNSKRKVSINGDTEQIEVDKPVKGNAEFKYDSMLDGLDSKDNRSDVVSFTFTSPIKKSGGGSSSCNTVLSTSSSYYADRDTCMDETGFRSSAETSLGTNVGWDALSVLLEQKLKELTSRVEMPQMPETSSHSNFDMGTTGLLKSLPLNMDTCKNNNEITLNSDRSSLDQQSLKAEKDNKKEYSHNLDKVSDNRNIDLLLQGPVSFSYCPSQSAATSDSSEVDRSSSNEGMISDTASSLSIGSVPQFGELQYILDLLNSAQLEFVLGRSYWTIAPDLFDRLQSKSRYLCKDTERDVLERKLLFDCVCECLHGRWSGSHKLWIQHTTLLQANDVYRQISSWKNDEELVMDELVEKDMSSKDGKWVDFEAEGFEEGVEMEESLLTCLLDELLDDLLF